MATIYVRKGWHWTEASKQKIRGEKHHNWKGGIRSTYYHRIIGYKQFMECSDCHVKKRVEVHHLNGNRYDNQPQNLTILCRRCHMTRDTRSGDLKDERLFRAHIGIASRRSVYQAALIPDSKYYRLTWIWS